jgi:hypothetical protein
MDWAADLRAAALHESAHAIAVLSLRSPNYRVKEVEIHPRKNGQGWDGACKRLTRCRAPHIGAEALIRLAGPAIESLTYSSRWDFGNADFDEAMAFLGDVASVHEHWARALRFVERERERIERLADALARPPHQLLEAQILEIDSAPLLRAEGFTALVAE